MWDPKRASAVVDLDRGLGVQSAPDGGASAERTRAGVQLRRVAAARGFTDQGG
ncbi:hypothetical protein PVAP13_3KG263560 [Panicum virgatum]|uniref:Uncharacterized protein n=1 Tax=Panicum virgatum TaxID=38727 RepID=A0A8T0V4J9_PANVG|nr:hypothetical protein PVAP13_3KG263560 [Panicum virgatum]